MMPHRNRIRTTLALTSMAALATALASSPAFAQAAPSLSYNAPDPTVASGSVRWIRGQTPGQEVYIVDSSTAVLDFTPSDTTGTGVINFQNANTQVRYVNGTGTTNYTVLNRIVPTDPTRAVQFNGTVVSQIQSGTLPATPGGTVWFYSPGGIVIGSTAVFNVGNLLLSSRDPTNGTGTISSTGSFTGGGAAGRAITVQPGASITASAEGSYIAMMSPIVNQGGTVQVNGSAAYVAAESATLTINSGLFDIVVGTGTDSSGTPLTHSGSTSGPSSTGSGDNHGIYMVAVPKNSAITMLLAPTGQLGFDVASSASIQNGRVVLSAGYNIDNGAIDQATVPGGTGAANVDLRSGNVTSNFTAQAKTNAWVVSTTGTPDFSGDVSLRGGVSAQLGARQAGETMSIGGDVTLVSDGSASVSSSGGITTTGGTTALYAETGASLGIAGSVTMTSEAAAVANPQTGAAGTATGGSAYITANNGTITIGSDVNISVNARGYDSPVAGVAGATLTGGNAGVDTQANGTIDIGGNTSVSATAVGSSGYAASSGTATGGSARIFSNATGGLISLQGNLTLNASASGNAASASGALGGNATGGSAYVRGSHASINVGGFTQLDASAAGGTPAAGADGGNGQGGNAFVQADAGASITLGDSVYITTEGRGGFNAGGGDGIGGSGTGGNATIQAGGDITIVGQTNLSARGFGGDKNAGASGGGGAGSGGVAVVRASTGTLELQDNLFVEATGFGGNSLYTTPGNGGTGTGGGARVDVTAASGVLTVAGETTLTADGLGGNGGLAAGSVGGNGFGGNQVNGNVYVKGAYAVASAGTLTFTGNLSMSADGYGGQGRTGGNGTGGIGYATGYDGDLTVGGALAGSFDGLGGDGLFGIVQGVGGGNGGTGTGGLFQVGTFATNGILGSVTLHEVGGTAEGFGGDGAQGVAGAGGRGGNGAGGTINIIGDASAGAVSATTVALSADGSGGDGGAGADGGVGANGFAGGAGGEGDGGSIQLGLASGANLTPNTGTVTFGTITTLSTGVGGDGGAGGNGGAGANGNTQNVNGGNGGNGGTGGLGGVGRGGSTALIARGNSVTADSLTALSIGIGGNGGEAGLGGAGGAPVGPGTPGNDGVDGAIGVGGAGYGGEAGMIVTNRNARPERGSLNVGAVALSTFGFGGEGSTVGDAFAGNGAVIVTNADATIGSFAFSNGFGGAPVLEPAISVEVANGVLDVNGSFAILSNGDMSFNIRDGGVLRATDVSLSGDGSLLPRDPSGVVGTPGLVDVTGNFSASFNSGDIGFDATVRAGDVQIFGDQIRVGDIDSGGFVSISGQDIQAGNIDSVSGINVIARPPEFGQPRGGDVVLGNLSASEGSVFVLAENGAITTGDITANDAVGLDGLFGVSAGDIVSARSNDPELGFVDIDSFRGPISVGDITSIEIAVNQGDFDAPVPASTTLGNLRAEKSTIIGVGSVTVGSVTAINTDSGFDPADGLQTVIAAGGNLIVGDASSHDTLILGSRLGSVTTGVLTSPGSIAVIGAQDITIGSATTGRGAEDVLFISGAAVLDDPRIAAYDESFENGDQPFDTGLLLQVNPAIGAGDVESGAISTGVLRAAAQNMRFDTIDASTRVELIASNNVGLFGSVIAPQIEISSGDIEIGASGSIGNASTTALSLLGTNGAQPMHVGGDGDQNGYSLDAAEALRLHAQTIDIAAAGGDRQSSATMLVHDLSLTGSGSNANLIGDAAELTLSSGGALRVDGDVAVSGLGSGDRVAFSSNTRVEVVTDSGSITLGSRGDNAPLSLSGTLSINAPVVAVGTSSLLEQLAADPRFASRNAALAAAAAQPNEAGFIQGGRIELEASNVIAIQNSGSATLAAGFTAGTGGMRISTPLSEQTTPPAQVVIYGRVQTGDTTYATNNATLGAITFAPSTSISFDTASLVNNCPIGTGCTVRGDDDGEEMPAVIGANVQDLQELLAINPAEITQIPAIRFVRVVDEDGLITETIITEPVSGTGNVSLWQVDETAGEGEDGATSTSKRGEEQ